MDSTGVPSVRSSGKVAMERAINSPDIMAKLKRSEAEKEGENELVNSEPVGNR